MGSFMIRTLVIGLVALAPAGLGAAPVLVGHARVIDGDTLAVGRVRVRLWGIDAAEHAAPGGPEATAALRRLVKGQLVTCAPARHPRDRYGRTVARCATRDTPDLACALVAAGRAGDWPRYSGGFYRRCRP